MINTVSALRRCSYLHAPCHHTLRKDVSLTEMGFDRFRLLPLDWVVAARRFHGMTSMLIT